MKKILPFLILFCASVLAANAQITLPHFEGFEDVTTFINDGWGMWYESSDQSNLSDFGIYNGDAYSGANSFQFCSYNSLSDNLYAQYLVTPKITSSSNIKISFYYEDSGDAQETFSVGYSSLASFSGDFSSFTWLPSITTSGNYTYSYYEAVVPAGTTFITIKYASYYLWYLNIDNVNLTATNETPTAPAVGTDVDLGVVVITDTNSYSGVTYDTVAYGQGLDIWLDWYNYYSSDNDYIDYLYFDLTIGGTYFGPGSIGIFDHISLPLYVGDEYNYNVTNAVPHDSIVAWGLLGQTVQVCVGLTLANGWNETYPSDNSYCYYVTFDTSGRSVDLGVWIVDDYDYDVLYDTVAYGYDLDINIDQYIYCQNAGSDDYEDYLYFDLTVDGVYKPGYLGSLDFTGTPFQSMTWDYYTATGLIPYDSIVAWGLLGRTVQVCIGLTLSPGYTDAYLGDNTYCYTVTFEGPSVVNTFTITATAGAGGTISPAGSTSVQQGNSQTYTITPSSCYAISDVIVNGVSQGAINSYTFNNVQANGTISASFTQQTYTVTVTVGANGTASCGTYTFAAGSTQTITFNCGDQPVFNFYPNGGYQINDVLANGSSVGSVASYQFPALGANATVNVSFSQIPAGTFIVSASAGVGGTISPNGTSNYSAGASATYTITADNCYTIKDVLVDGVSVGAVGTYSFNNIQANGTITASFQITTYNVTVTASAGGSVTCGTYTVPAGQTVVVPVNCGDQPVFTFYPDNGYQIGSVVVNNSNVGTASTYQMPTVGADGTLVANFISSSANSYTITATAGNGGSITPSGTSNYSEGSSATYTITPDNCYAISDVLVNGTSVGATVSYTFTNIQANQSIYVTFSPQPVTITVTAGAGGSIVYNGQTIPGGTTQQVTVECGTSPVFTFIPDANYHVAQVIVDGTNVGNGTTYTYPNVSGDGTLTVEFAEGVSVAEYGFDFNIWPNPASDILNVELHNSGDTRVMIINMLGEVVGTWDIASSNGAINISELTSGVYFVRISSQKGIATKKFVKE
ncbi:MAG: T9SS type A sorting domain-containing protein [Bacteroidales bacterium]|nr:T9SS type A sorting domain-containing protein [Bacteroidales bacterium]